MSSNERIAMPLLIQYRCASAAAESSAIAIPTLHKGPRRHDMKLTGSFSIAVVLTIALSLFATAAEKKGQENISFTIVEASNMTATVTDIDRQARTVQLTDSEGKVRTIKVDASIHNFNEVRKGDTVTVEVQENLEVEVQPGPGNTMNIGSESQTAPLPGQKPASMRTIEGILKTEVQAIDYEARTVTFKNRKGVLTTYKLGKDAKRFDEVRRGDMLVVEYKQITVLSVK